MQILITEFMDAPAVDALRETHEVIYDPQIVDDPPRLLAKAPHCDAIIVRNRTQVRGELLQALTRCRVVGRLGVGLDNIDVRRLPSPKHTCHPCRGSQRAGHACHGI